MKQFHTANAVVTTSMCDLDVITATFVRYYICLRQRKSCIIIIYGKNRVENKVEFQNQEMTQLRQDEKLKSIYVLNLAEKKKKGSEDSDEKETKTDYTTTALWETTDKSYDQLRIKRPARLLYPLPCSGNLHSSNTWYFVFRSKIII